MTTWTIIEFRAWIASGCPKNDDVRELDLSNNQLTFLPAEIGKLVTLQQLDLSDNKLTFLPAEIGKLVTLQTLYLYNNQLAFLPVEIGQLVALKILNLSFNQLAFLPVEIGQLVALKILNLSFNQLTFLPVEIGQLVTLQQLYLYNNKLTFLPVEIGQLVALQTLVLSGNRLVSIPAEIGQLVNLQTLHISNNQLTFLPVEIGQLAALKRLDLANNQLASIPSSLGECHQLQYLLYRGNPLEYIPPNVVRLLRRQTQAQGVYTDRQSVHNSSIQTSIKDSIMRLLSVKPICDFEAVTALILSDETLTPFTKSSLVEYCKDESVHTVLNLTFSDLLTAVWNRIVANENAIEIKAILNTEMMDAECKCFTGRISRLVNCLNGFDSSITITINDNEQIGNIILLIKEKLTASDEGYSAAKHRELVRVQLEERGYATVVIEEWLEYID